MSAKPPDPNAPFRAAVNKGGYPFQLAVEDRIRHLPPPNNWQFVSHEIPHENGYLDIIAHRGAIVAMIECKRFLKQDWIFLVPQGASDNEVRLRVNVSHNGPDEHYGLEDVSMPLGSFEASFCEIHGDRGNLTIERLAGDLTRAVVSIASTPGRAALSAIEVFLPILVTTARLPVCLYDPSQLDVADGNVNPDATFREVNMIRFRKTLSGLRNRRPAESLLIRDMIQAEEETVLVCNGSHIARMMADIAHHGMNDVDDNPIRRRL